MCKCYTSLEQASEDDEEAVTVNPEVNIPQWMFDDAKQAAKWSQNDDDSIRDHLLDHIEVSPEILVDGEPIKNND